MAGVTMADPKRKVSKPKRKTGIVTVNVKASPEWKAWLDGLTAHCRTDIAKLIDRGLILVAKAEGYGKEAPPR